MAEYERLLGVTNIRNADAALSMHDVLVPIVMKALDGVVNHTGGQLDVAGDLVVAHEWPRVVREGAVPEGDEEHHVVLLEVGAL